MIDINNNYKGVRFSGTLYLDASIDFLWKSVVTTGVVINLFVKQKKMTFWWVGLFVLSFFIEFYALWAYSGFIKPPYQTAGGGGPLTNWTKTFLRLSYQSSGSPFTGRSLHKFTQDNEYYKTYKHCHNCKCFASDILH